MAALSPTLLPGPNSEFLRESDTEKHKKIPDGTDEI